MALMRAKPITFSARGCTDAIDGTPAPEGSMQQLANLVPSPSTPNQWVPRPASILITDFTGSSITSPGVISETLVVGPRIYGMVASTSGGTNGKDVPFCYDTSTASFVTISGIAAGNLPATLSSSGDWQPPHMEMIGTTIVLAHVGFPGGGGAFIGHIDVSNPAAPAWGSGNTATNALVAVPSWVSRFNGRAWYAVNNSLVFSDANAPLTVTNASQVLIVGDSMPITGMGGLGLNSTTQGGVVQALIVFKDDEAPWQVTGDSATNNLLLNAIPGGVGSNAPNTITPVPLGLAYVAPDGVRIIDKNGQCSDPIGANGQGISVPFIYSVFPTRMSAAFNHNTYAISTQNNAAPTQPYQEWWLNFTTKGWSGPHSGVNAIISAFEGSAGTTPFGQDFIKAIQGVPGKLFAQATVPLASSGYIENGTQLNWKALTTLLPDNSVMAMNAEIETSVGLVIPPTHTVLAIMTDEGGNNLGQVSLLGGGAGPTVWGAFTWGAALWGGTPGYFQQYQLFWQSPLVFKQAQLQITGDSVAGIAVGNFYMRYQILGYLLQNALAS